jgi:hypothetical protein
MNRKSKTSKLLKEEAIELIENTIIFCTENSLVMKYTSKELENLYLSYN